ncbi:MAG: hypothetical protein K2O38_00480 [Muribaculaceae bacterium]|nr:hypothetical protein [Muribaculaceae bacterium]
MKKSIAILSMALMACNAFAADVLEAGTADAPKYYIIKANRGAAYVAYGEETKDNGGALTHLFRTDDLSANNVWAVVGGEAEGTLNIYNYSTKDADRKAYLMAYITKSGDEFTGGLNAVANTVGRAKDIFVKDYEDGSYGLSLFDAAGYVQNGEVMEYYGLDATSNSEFLGNWFCANDAGSKWWFYSVDDANGIEAGIAGAQSAINADKLKELEAAQKAFAATYVGAMEAIIANVPVVESAFADAIDEVNQLEVVEDYEAQITAIWFAAIESANAELKTVYADNIVALKNLRRADAQFNQPPYLAVVESALTGVNSFADASADFTMKLAGESGYYIYNETTKSYIGADCSVAADQASAQVFDLIIAAGGGFYGVGICPAGQTANGINWQSWANGMVSIYSVTDAGSVWSLVEASEEAKVKDAVSSSVAKIQPYIANVPAMVANVLNAGLDELNALTFTADIAEKAEAIANQTIATANNLLTTGMNGLQQTIYYPRGNKFLSYSSENADWTPVDNNYSASEVFTFKTVEGGVVIFNEANNIYVGPAVVDASGSQYDVTVVTDEAEAQVFTVELNNNSGYYGVSFLFDEEVVNSETQEVSTRVRALNMNLNAKCLHTYAAADGGSIFVLKDKGDDSSINEISVVAPAVQGIYDLSGRKLSAPVRGINIINGKKVLVK